MPFGGSSSRFRLCLSVCHAAFDAMSMAAFPKDLQSALRQRNFIEQSTNTLHGFRRNLLDPQRQRLGKTDRRVKFISSKVSLSCLWPPSKGPGCFIGPDDGWEPSDGSPGHSPDRVSSDYTAAIPRGRAILSKDTWPAKTQNEPLN